jgi:hypothetical protein
MVQNVESFWTSIISYITNIVLLGNLAVIQISILENPPGFRIIQLPLLFFVSSLLASIIYGIYTLVWKKSKPSLYVASIGPAILYYSIVLLLILVANFMFNPTFVYFGILLCLSILFNLLNLINRVREKKNTKYRVGLSFCITVALFVYTYYTIQTLKIA